MEKVNLLLTRRKLDGSQTLIKIKGEVTQQEGTDEEVRQLLLDLDQTANTNVSLRLHIGDS